MDTQYEQRDWTEHTTALAPPLLGAAAGFFVADALDRDLRHPVGYTLAGLGLAVLAPALVVGIVKKINGPHSRRGSQRRLQGIRDGGAPVHEVRYLENEYSTEELGVG